MQDAPERDRRSVLGGGRDYSTPSSAWSRRRERGRGQGRSGESGGQGVLVVPADPWWRVTPGGLETRTPREYVAPLCRVGLKRRHRDDHRARITATTRATSTTTSTLTATRNTRAVSTTRRPSGGAWFGVDRGGIGDHGRRHAPENIACRQQAGGLVWRFIRPPGPRIARFPHVRGLLGESVCC
jgi:hypothetical protein